MEKTAIASNQHYCITAEDMQMKDGKKLQSYIGICCHYPKVIWKSDNKIYSEDGSVCIQKSLDESDVKFTTDSKYSFNHNHNHEVEFVNLSISSLGYLVSLVLLSLICAKL